MSAHVIDMPTGGNGLRVKGGVTVGVEADEEATEPDGDSLRRVFALSSNQGAASKPLRQSPSDVVCNHLYGIAMWAVIIAHILVEKGTMSPGTNTPSPFYTNNGDVFKLTAPVMLWCLPAFFFVPGWKDAVQPPSSWRDAAISIAFTGAMGLVLKLPMLIEAHADVSWLVQNVMVYRVAGYSLHLCLRGASPTVRTAGPIVLGLITFEIGRLVRGITLADRSAVLWPLDEPSLDQRAGKEWLYDLFSGRMVASMWAYYALLPRLLPPAAFAPLPTRPFFSLGGKLTVSVGTAARLIACLVIVICTLALFYGKHILGPTLFPYLASAGQSSNTNYLALLMLPAIIILLPRTPSVISALGERTFVCLLLHFAIICSVFFDLRRVADFFSFSCNSSGESSDPANDPYALQRWCLPSESFLRTHPSNYSEPTAMTVFKVILAFLLQVATSFHLRLAPAPAWLSDRVPSGRWYSRLGTCQFPFLDFPSARAAAASWVLLLLLGVVRVPPVPYQPAAAVPNGTINTLLSAHATASPSAHVDTRPWSVQASSLRLVANSSSLLTDEASAVNAKRERLRIEVRTQPTNALTAPLAELIQPDALLGGLKPQASLGQEMRLQPVQQMQAHPGAQPVREA